MAAPEYAIDLVVRGRDEASAALGNVYNAMRREGETVEQGKQRWREYTQEVRQLTRAQRFSHQAWQRQNDVMLDAMNVMNQVGMMGRTVMRIFTQYTLMMTRLEQAQRAVAEAQKDLNEAQADYVASIYKSGAGSEEARRAYQRLQQAQERLHDQQEKVNEIASQNRMAFLMMGMSALQLVGNMRTLMVAMNQLRISMGFSAAAAGASGAKIAGMGAGAAGAAAGTAGMTTKIGMLIPKIGLFIAAAGLAYYAYTRLTAGSATTGEEVSKMTFEYEHLSKEIRDMYATLNEESRLRKKAIEEIGEEEVQRRDLTRQFRYTTGALVELTGMTEKQLDAEIEYGNFIPIIVEGVKKLQRAGKDEAEIIEALINLRTKHGKQLLDEKKIRDIVRAATQDQLRDTIRAYKEQGVWVEEAIAYVEKFTGSIFVARSIVREFYGDITTNAKQAAQANRDLFEATAKGLPTFLRGFETGERTIKGMAEETRLRFGQIADVISEVTGARVQLFAPEFFAEALRGMGIDVGDFTHYTEEQLSMLYVMMQENPVLTKYVWQKVMQDIGEGVAEMTIAAGVSINELSATWVQAAEAPRKYLRGVEDALKEVDRAIEKHLQIMDDIREKGGIATLEEEAAYRKRGYLSEDEYAAMVRKRDEYQRLIEAYEYEPEFLKRLRGIKTAPIVEEARRRAETIPRAPMKITRPQVEREGLVFPYPITTDYILQIIPRLSKEDIDRIFDLIPENVRIQLIPYIEPHSPLSEALSQIPKTVELEIIPQMAPMPEISRVVGENRATWTFLAQFGERIQALEVTVDRLSIALQSFGAGLSDLYNQANQARGQATVPSTDQTITINIENVRTEADVERIIQTLIRRLAEIAQPFVPRGAG